MWWKIQQLYVASVIVFAILAVQNVQSQNLAECSGKFMWWEFLDLSVYIHNANTILQLI